MWVSGFLSISLVSRSFKFNPSDFRLTAAQIGIAIGGSAIRGLKS